MARNAGTSTVLVGYVDDASSSAVLRAGAVEAALRHASLTIVHQLVGTEKPEAFGPTRDVEAARRATAEAINRAARHAAPHIEVIVRLSARRIADELTAMSRNAALVVLGSTVTHAASAALLDSVSHEVARRATCPTLLIPHHGAPRARSPLVCGIDRSDASSAALDWTVKEAELRRTEVLAVEIGRPTGRVRGRGV